MKFSKVHTHGLKYVLFLFASLLIPQISVSLAGYDIDKNSILIGSDYRTFTLDENASARDCRRACKDDTRCRAWTYVKPRRKTRSGIRFDLGDGVSFDFGGRDKIIPPQCRLKYNAGQRRVNFCCASGVKKVRNVRRGNKRTFCAKYAETSLDQQDKNLVQRCNYRGRYWSEEYGQHFDWCMQVRKRKANQQQSSRNDKLSTCREDRHQNNDDRYNDRDRNDDRYNDRNRDRDRGHNDHRIEGRDRYPDRDWNRDQNEDRADHNHRDNDQRVARQFKTPVTWINKYTVNRGGWNGVDNPRVMADVNGDGRADIVGFSNDGVYVSLSQRGRFGRPKLWIRKYGVNNGGWNGKANPRMMADVNGDRRADIVGFSNDGVYVSLNQHGHFSQPKLWIRKFTVNTGGWSVAQNPRMMADVNGDGRADIVGFANDGVYVSLSKIGRFSWPKIWIKKYTINTGGWDAIQNPRMMADVNGDGRADIVGFSNDGVYVSLSKIGRFSTPQIWIRKFTVKRGGWNGHANPRVMADVNGDGRADIVGFSNDGVYVSLSQRHKFARPQLWIRAFGVNNGGWKVPNNPRMAADVDGDGQADLIGFSNDGVNVAIRKGNGDTRRRRR